MLRLRFLSPALAAVLALAACDVQTTSLFDPDAPAGTAPVIESVTPNASVLAGIDVIEITGRGFSATPSDNRVSFDDGAGAVGFGTVLEASPTRLRVRVPNLINAALRMRVAVAGAPDFSNALTMPLLPAFVSFGAIAAGEREIPGGAASDAAGNLYVSLTRLDLPRGIVRFAPNGTRSQYYAASGSNFPWIDLTFNQVDSQVYGVRAIQALFRLLQGNEQQTVQPVQTATTRLVALDADPQGRLWAAGSQTPLTAAEILRFNLNGTVLRYPFPRAIRALRVAGSNLYAVVNDGEGSDPQSRVVRFTLDASGAIAGEAALVYDVSGSLGSAISAYAIAVAADGTLFIGTNNRPDPIIEIPPGGSPSPLYPGVLPSPAFGLEWATGSELYMITGDNPITPLVTEPANIIKIQTRRARPS